MVAIELDAFSTLTFQAGVMPPDLMAIRSQITALEEEREENQWKVEQYEELKAKNGAENKPELMQLLLCELPVLVEF